MENNNTKKLINYRPVVMFGFVLIIGAYISAFMFTKPYLFIVASIMFVLMLLISLIYSIKKNNSNLLKQILFCVIIPMLISSLVVYINIKSMTNDYIDSQFCQVEGRVESLSSYNENSVYYITLSNVSLVKDEQVSELKNNIVLVYKGPTNLSDLKTGDNISCFGSYTNTFSLSDDFDITTLSSGVVGKAYSFSKLDYYEGSGVRYKLTSKVLDNLNDSMDKDSASVAYSMLFGSKTKMSEELKSAFSASGLAHVLAVSGLHITFLITLINFVLKKFIKNKKWINAILIVVVLFYDYLCGFSATVVRATIMSFCLIFAEFFGEQYDRLIALSVAGILNFVIQPLKVFSVGFMLSFGVVFALISLAPTLSLKLKSKLPEKLSGSLAVTISAWAGSFPILLFYFKTINLYSVLINLVMIPFIGILYSLLVVSVILSIIPIFKFLLVGVGFMVKAFVFIVNTCSNLAGIGLNVGSGVISLILFSVAIIFAGDYILDKRKYLVSSIMFLSGIICILSGV